MQLLIALQLGSNASIVMRTENFEYCIILLQSHGGILGVTFLGLILNMD